MYSEDLCVGESRDNFGPRRRAVGDPDSSTEKTFRNIGYSIGMYIPKTLPVGGKLYH